MLIRQSSPSQTLVTLYKKNRGVWCACVQREGAPLTLPARERGPEAEGHQRAASHQLAHSRGGLALLHQVGTVYR